MTLLVERSDDWSECDHPDVRRCHAKRDAHGMWYHDRIAWHIWDTDRDDYAAGTGPAQFARRRDARQWLAGQPSQSR